VIARKFFRWSNEVSDFLNNIKEDLTKYFIQIVSVETGFLIYYDDRFSFKT
jgi:hypothetical protein